MLLTLSKSESKETIEFKEYCCMVYTSCNQNNLYFDCNS